MFDFNKEINELEKNGMLRVLNDFTPNGSVLRGTFKGLRVINFSSNSYLGLDSNKNIKEAMAKALEENPSGAEASRLITGTNSETTALEKVIAEWKKTEAALIFSTGYMANVGVISAIADRDTDLFLDKLDHASIVDGAVLSRANIIRYPHCDMAALEKLLKKSVKSKKIVVTDTVFSMDGDIAPLGEISDICKKNGALLIADDAHATGVFGKTGGGVGELLEMEDKIDILIGTFSKGLGLTGGYCAAKKEIIDFLINKSRSLIFTTALPPFIIAGIAKAVEICRLETGAGLRAKLAENINKVKQVLPSAQTQIIPLLAGSAENALNMRDAFLEKGLLALPIRPPSVPQGSSRLRISLSAGHTDAEIAALISALKQQHPYILKG